MQTERTKAPIKSWEEVDTKGVFEDFRHALTGLIIIGGQTGTGKTTTSLSLLSEVMYKDVVGVVIGSELDWYDLSTLKGEVEYYGGTYSPEMLRLINKTMDKKRTDVVFMDDIRTTKQLRFATKLARKDILVIVNTHLRNQSAAVQKMLNMYGDTFSGTIESATNGRVSITHFTELQKLPKLK